MKWKLLKARLEATGLTDDGDVEWLQVEFNSIQYRIALDAKECRRNAISERGRECQQEAKS